MECLQANAREESVAEKERSEQQERTLASRVRLQESQEIVYKEQIEQMQTRIRALEGRVRQKEEELYSVQRVVTSMERDMQNMMEVENSLKMEL
jgi:tRNA C32,U32 (ribose-2'-O)-methylase TrmJ